MNTTEEFKALVEIRISPERLLLQTISPQPIRLAMVLWELGHECMNPFYFEDLNVISN